YGALRGRGKKWLNLELLFRRLREQDEVQIVRYFTTLVKAPPSVDQQTYHRALATLPVVRVVLGRFKRRQRTCRVSSCTYEGSKLFSSLEEKRTDVNIALSMLDDAYRDRYDMLVLVTGDSDLVPAVEMVKHRFPKKRVVVYVPTRSAVRGAATELRRSADKHRTLPQRLLAICQFPTVLETDDGAMIAKPASW
ncbi:MAG: NYN domain-containing protein, partial [Planctomycetota bacterium]